MNKHFLMVMAMLGLGSSVQAPAATFGYSIKQVTAVVRYGKEVQDIRFEFGKGATFTRGICSELSAEMRGHFVSLLATALQHGRQAFITTRDNEQGARPTDEIGCVEGVTLYSERYPTPRTGS